MNTSLKKLAVGVVVLTVTLLAVGCESSYPQPSEDAVYYFLANYRLHGKMRVCWPAGQEYAVGITKADATLQTELDSLHDLALSKRPWNNDDPQWRDKQVLSEQIEGLTKALGEGKTKRLAAIEKIRAAIKAVPDDLSLESGPARESFETRLWGALKIDDLAITVAMNELEEIAKARLSLLAKVYECQDSLLPDSLELRFEDETIQNEYEHLSTDFHAKASARNERFLQFATRRIEEIAPIVKSIDKQKQREEYNYLDSQRQYFRHKLEAELKGWIAEIDSIEKQLAAHESGKEKLPGAEAAYLVLDLVRTREAYAMQKPRVDQILSPFKRVEQGDEPIINPAEGDD